MITVKSNNPLWTYVEKYVMKSNHGLKHPRHVVTPSGMVRVFDGTVEVERIIHGNPNTQHITRGPFK